MRFSNIWRKMDCIVNEVYRYVKKMIKGERLIHSIGVAIYADYLCERFGQQGKSCFIAGLAHDVARELEGDEMIAHAARYSGEAEELEKSRPILLHGKAGAFLLRRDLGIMDSDILEAVAWHVTGRPGMSLTEKCVFIADYFAPDREFIEESERLMITNQDIDRLMIFVLERTFDYLKREGKDVAYTALSLYKELKGVQS